MTANENEFLFFEYQMQPFPRYFHFKESKIQSEYEKYLSTINPNSKNILLFGVYPNVADNFFRSNKSNIDTKKLLSDGGDYTFISHYWLTPLYTGDKKPLPGYRSIYADFNRKIFYDILINIGYEKLFDVIFVDSYVLCHIYDPNRSSVFNFFLKYIKPNGIIYFRTHDIDKAKAFNWENFQFSDNYKVEFTYYNSTPKELNIDDYFCSDDVVMSIKFTRAHNSD